MIEITENPADRANHIPWPPIIQVSALLGAWLLGWLMPWPLLPEAMPVRGLGWLVFAGGLGIAISGMRYFRSIGTPVDPTGSAQKLADGGIYNWTRNPMYAGVSMAFAGLAFGLASAWLLVLALLMPLALQKLAIEPEEAYLTRRFGTAYAAYCARVRRWL